jgi:hypothetical protein
MEMSDRFHVPTTLPQRKSPLHPLDRRLSGLQSRSEHGGEEKNSQPLSGLEPPIIQPAAQRGVPRCTVLNCSPLGSLEGAGIAQSV